MGAIRDLAKMAFRDFVSDGIPASGKHSPRKNEIRNLFRLVDQEVVSAEIGRVDAATWSDLAALTGGREGQPARVVGPDAGTHTDPVVGGSAANTGTYIWSASPAGWRRVGGLDAAIVLAANTGAGTADSVQATSDVAFDDAPGKALITINFLATNTGSMTLSINGETPRPLVTNTGQPIPAGYIGAGMAALVQIDADGNYRLFSYGDASAIEALVEALLVEVTDEANRAEAARNAAQSYSAMLSADKVRFATVPVALADTTLSYSGGPGLIQVSAGDRFQAGEFWYEVAADDASDHDLETAGGVKLYVQKEDGRYNIACWGVISDSTDGTDGTDQTAAIVGVVQQMNDAGYRGEIYIPYGTKFDKLAVYGAALPGIGFADDSQINWWATPSYKQRIKVHYTSDLVNDDSVTMLASNHHPALFLMNFGTAGSTSANERYSTVLYGAGLKPNGEYMTGLYHQVGGLSGEWVFRVMLQTPFDIATKVTAWSPETEYALGAIVQIYPGSGRVYECTVAGISGSVAPSHASGTATDGTVTWQFRQNSLQLGSTLWRVDERGNTIQTGTRGAKTLTHTYSLSNTGFANFSSLFQLDAEYRTVSVTFGNSGYINLGHSGGPASITSPGVSVARTLSNGSAAIYATTQTLGPSLVQTSLAEAAATFTQFRRGPAGTITGSISHDGSGATAYNTSSDRRLKANERDFDSGDVIDKLEVWHFDWTNVQGSAYGVMAQDAAEIFPNAVTRGNGDPGDDDFEPWGVDYSKFVPLLLREIKKLRSRVAQLEQS